MKKFDLNACGVQEMEVDEMKKTEGGCIFAALVILATAWLAAELIYDVANGQPYDVTDGDNLIG